jgi:hypothetical protein
MILRPNEPLIISTAYEVLSVHRNTIDGNLLLSGNPNNQKVVVICSSPIQRLHGTAFHACLQSQHRPAWMSRPQLSATFVSASAFMWLLVSPSAQIRPHNYHRRRVQHQGLRRISWPIRQLHHTGKAGLHCSWRNNSRARYDQRPMFFGLQFRSSCLKPGKRMFCGPRSHCNRGKFG